MTTLETMTLTQTMAAATRPDARRASVSQRAPWPISMATYAGHGCGGSHVQTPNATVIGMTLKAFPANGSRRLEELST